MTTNNHPIVDSHIHLYTSHDIPYLAWTPSLPPSHVLKQSNALNEYHFSTSQNPSISLTGFIFVETDRISSLDPTNDNAKGGWDHVYDELRFLMRIVSGQLDGTEEDKYGMARLCKGIVAWAPVPLGAEWLQRYTARAWAIADGYGHGARNKVKGFRYLLQDQPMGTMLQPGFAAGVRWLGEQGLTFDLGIDARQGGEWQLREAAEMLARVYAGVEAGKGTRVVINHLCKPNMLLPPAEIAISDDFRAWKACIEQMAAFPDTFMKLSGGFSEMQEQDGEVEAPVDTILDHLRPWARAVFEAFGPSRIMFGSDWPVCNVNGRGPQHAWSDWKGIVTRILEELNLDDNEKGMIWLGTATRAYRIE